MEYSNRSAQKFYNLNVEFQGYVTDDDYTYAKDTYVKLAPQKVES